MKKNLIFTILGAVLILGLVAGIGFLLVSDNDENGGPSVDESPVPARLSELGPYAKNIKLTEKLGKYDITISADRLHMRKTKFMGFDCALYKQVVTRNTRISVYKSGQKMLEVKKDRVILPPSMKIIEIKDPQVTYPENLKKVSRIKIDKDKKLLTLYHGGKSETWNLNN